MPSEQAAVTSRGGRRPDEGALRRVRPHGLRLATIARNECWARIRARMPEPLPADEVEAVSAAPREERGRVAEHAREERSANEAPGSSDGESASPVTSTSGSSDLDGGGSSA
jgi:hypothetical protein